MNNTRTSALASLAIVAGLGFAGSGASMQPVRDPSQSLQSAAASARAADMNGTAQQLHRASADKFMRMRVGMGRSGPPRPPRPPGTGWPVATDRRRAREARNVARNRKAHK